MSYERDVSGSFFLFGSTISAQKIIMIASPCMQVLSPSVVMQLQVPLMAPMIAATVRKAVAQNDSIYWYKQMRQLSFSMNTRAVAGSLVTEKDCEEFFELFQVIISGAFTPVRLSFLLWFCLCQCCTIRIYCTQNQVQKLLLKLRLFARISYHVPARKLSSPADTSF